MEDNLPLSGADVEDLGGADVEWITLMSPFFDRPHRDISDLPLDPFFGKSQKRLVIAARRFLRLKPSVKITLAGVRINTRVKLAKLFDSRGLQVFNRGRGGQTAPYLLG